MRLINGEAKAKAHPDTWFIPPARKRMAAEAGDWVKLGFVIDEPIDGCGGERPWVKVTRGIDDTGIYEGEIDNELVVIDGLKFQGRTMKLGARVKFKPKHILDWVSASYVWD